jgi:phosphoenolpyruvate carboxykinase (ATP)
MTKDLGVRNPSASLALCGLETTGVVRYNLDRQAHRPLGAGQVHRARCQHRDQHLVGQQQGDDAGPLRGAEGRLPAHAKGKRLFVQDLYGGADPEHRIKVRVVTQFAWHALFIRYLLRRPEPKK